MSKRKHEVLEDPEDQEPDIEVIQLNRQGADLSKLENRLEEPVAQSKVDIDDPEPETASTEDDSQEPRSVKRRKLTLTLKCYDQLLGHKLKPFGIDLAEVWTVVTGCAAVAFEKAIVSPSVGLLGVLLRQAQSRHLLLELEVHWQRVTLSMHSTKNRLSYL